MTDTLLQVNNLTTHFSVNEKSLCAVNDISFEIKKGQTIGLVGESGCGKSVTSLSILRLLQAQQATTSGKALFDGEDIFVKTDKEMRKLRGNRISMIFQEPMTSLNPVFTIGNQISAVFQIHQGLSKRDAWNRSIEMLKLVKIPAPEKRIYEYPNQLSGGMRQRVMIAMALACKPSLLIADEPTTALDVTIQAQILDLMSSLQKELNMAILLITHDLGVVAEVCDYVMVMYAGRIVEKAPTKEIFNNPKHPYTIGLLKSIPRLGRRVDKLPTIEGTVPSLEKLPNGCSFQERCPEALDKCKSDLPLLSNIKPNHHTSCWLNR